MTASLPVTEPAESAARVRRLAHAASAAVILLGLTGSIGWIFDVPMLRSVIPDLVAMKMNTAASFVLAGSSLALQVERGSMPRGALLGRLLALLVAAVGLLTLAQYVFHADLGIDQLLIRAPAGEAQTASPGRMAPVSALSFVLSGTALAALDAPMRAARASVTPLAVAVLLIGYLAVAGYVLNIRALYDVAGDTSIAVHTAAGFVVLSIGVLLSRPQRGFVATLAQDTPAGAAFRRLLPLIVFTPLAVAWAQLKGQQAGLYGPDFGHAITVTVCTTFIGALAIWNAAVQGASETARRQAIESSTERFRALVDASAQIVWSTNGSGEVVEDSPSWRAFTGQTLAQWQSQRGLEALHPDDRVRVTAIWRSALATKAVAETEYRILHKSGQWRWTAMRAVPVFDADKSVREWVGMNVDITDRRAAEQAKLSAERVQERSRFFDLSLDLVCIANTDGYFVELNPAFPQTLGYENEDLVKQPFLDFVHPDDRAATLAEVEKLALGAPTLQFTNRYRCKDGSDRWFQWRATSDDSGLIYAIARDVTDDLKKAKALAESEERLRLLVEGAVDYALILLDAEGRVIRWNVGAQRMKGYSSEEILGQSFSKFYTEEDRKSGHPEAELEQARATGRHEEEGFRVRKDGSRFWANVDITALRDSDGTLRGFAKVTRDFTERRRVQDALQAREASLSASLREREVLLQEVHHRVKNNLQVIASLIHMQIRQVADSQTQGALRECQTRVETIALIHEKLYQARDYSNVRFSDYVRSLAGNVFSAMGTSSSRVALDLRIEAIAITVDKAIPCGLILNELITNALKHAFPLERCGSIRVEARETSDQLIELSVADDGVGLSDSFEPEESETLGMQLVTMLVEQLHGRLHITRSGGTMFTVTFRPAEVAS